VSGYDLAMKACRGACAKRARFLIKYMRCFYIFIRYHLLYLPI